MDGMNGEGIEVSVAYGLGAGISARLERDWSAHRTLRELVARVVEAPRPPGRAARAASVLADVLRSGRELDAELVKPGEPVGEPVALDEVFVPKPSRPGNGSRAEEDRVGVLISEPYVGGSRGASGPA